MSLYRAWMRVLAVTGLAALAFSYTVPVAQAVGKDPGPAPLPALELVALSFPSFDEHARGASEESAKQAPEPTPAPEPSAPDRSPRAPAPVEQAPAPAPAAPAGE